MISVETGVEGEVEGIVRGEKEGGREEGVEVREEWGVEPSREHRILTAQLR